MNAFFYWTPRALSLLFVGLVSLFALDVFGEYQGTELLVALLVHLIPSFVLLGAVLVAWKYEVVGVVGFLAFAAWYVWEAGFDKPWSWYALIAGLAVIIALLYFVGWLQKRAASRVWGA